MDIFPAVWAGCCVVVGFSSVVVLFVALLEVLKPPTTLRVCVVGLVPNLTPLKMLTKMLTFFHMHRFCSNMAHFKGMEALISDPF